jgi:hypothetical protein
MAKPWEKNRVFPSERWGFNRGQKDFCPASDRRYSTPGAALFQEQPSWDPPSWTAFPGGAFLCPTITRNLRVVAHVQTLAGALNPIAENGDRVVLKNFLGFGRGEFLAGDDFFVYTAKINNRHVGSS